MLKRISALLLLCFLCSVTAHAQVNNAPERTDYKRMMEQPSTPPTPPTIGVAAFTGVGVNDLTPGGTYTPVVINTYTVIIDGTGTPDTFKWKKNAGAFTNGVAITGAAQTLTDGVQVTFTTTTGHTLTDQWVVTETPMMYLFMTSTGLMGVVNNAGTVINPAMLGGALTPDGFIYADANGNIGTTAATTNGQILIGSTGAIPAIGSITGTANQITVTPGAGTIALSIPSVLNVTTGFTIGGAAATGTILRGNGTNFIGTTATYPNTVTSGDVVIATGSNAIGSLAVGGTGTIIRSTGSAPAYTTATYPNTVATGDLITATGTNVIGSLAIGTAGRMLQVNAGATAGAWVDPPINTSIMFPVGLIPPINATNVTTNVTNTSYFQYIGRAQKAYSTMTLRFDVTTNAATITWAEVGVFKGAPTIGGTASLTRVGFTDVSATFNSTGVKNTSVSVSSVNIGDELWIAWGSQATTPFQLRGTVADELQTGVYQQFSGRISTMSLPTTTTLSANSLVPAWGAAQ